MKPLNRIYIPLGIFIIMVVLTWLEEAFFMEGKYQLNAQGLTFLRSIIRMGFVLLLFILGYTAFQYMGIKWLKKIWIAYYVIVFGSSFIRLFTVLVLKHNFSYNQYSLLSSFYTFGITPLPFLILWLLEVLIIPKIQQAKDKK